MASIEFTTKLDAEHFEGWQSQIPELRVRVQRKIRDAVKRQAKALFADVAIIQDPSGNPIERLKV